MREYRPDIDGLRAIAVCAVILYHAFPGKARSGFIGVDIFFVISGYLIGGIILRELNEGKFSFFEFYNRRIRRIFPSLVLVLCVSLIFGSMALFPDEFSALGRYVFGGAFFVSNVFLWQDAGYFDTISRMKPLLHLWSLGIEEQFYIFFPLVLYIGVKKRFNVLTLIFGLCMVSFLVNICYIYDRTADFYNPLARFWELFAGAILAAIQQTCVFKLNDNNSGFLKLWRGLGLTIMGFALLTCAFSLCKPYNPHPGWQALLPVGGALACIAAKPNILNKIILSNRVAVYIGIISYPFYLWHWVLLSFGWIVYEMAWPLRLGLIAISFFLAVLTYEFWEKPIRFGRKSRRTLIKLCGGVGAIGVAGMVVFLNSGFPQRGEFKTYTAVLEQLDKSSLADDNEVAYAGIPPERFRRCRYTDINAKETVALIGDSHALAAYSGVARLGYELGYNTVVMTRAVPGCSLMEGEEYKVFPLQMTAVFEALTKQPDITKVFWCLQGSKQLSVLERSLHSKEKAAAVFANEMQYYIDLLNKQGKEVYILSDNPTLPADIRYYIGDKFGDDLLIKRSAPPPLASEIYKSQENYLTLLSRLHGATIIDVIGPMCLEGQCRLFTDDGLPMYGDDNHLSTAGSDFQAKYVLYPFLRYDSYMK